MNIIFFIRLLQKHILILIITPILLAGVVFYLTRNEPKLYDSSTRIYTGIATGSSIVSLEESKLDLFGTRIAFDNLINLIKTNTTIEEVSLRLFAKHLMLDAPKPEIILSKHYYELKEMVPDDVKALVVKNDAEQTYQNLLNYKNRDHKNFIYQLIYLDNPHYSIKKILAEIKVARIQSSDMVRITFNSNDPGICTNTLELINKVFERKYSQLKVNQSDAVVRYFQKEISGAQNHLNKAEEDLVTFNKEHNIINYYEQTRHIASEKEHFDLSYTEIKMKHMAQAAVIKLIEGKMSANQKRSLNSSEMLMARRKLSDLNHQLWMKSNARLLNKEESPKDSADLVELKKRVILAESKLKQLVEKQYSLNNSKEGIDGNSLLKQWLEKIIAFEASNAQLEVGDQIKEDFNKLFEYYAPLGATMKRLERKINVAEQKYLSLLESLNKAKLKQQNVELNSNLKIVAPPFFPIEARASKRKFLLIVAFMVGFIIPAFIILILEFLDASIKTIRRAEEYIGHKVLAMFPNLLSKNKRVNFSLIKNKSLDVIARKLLLYKSTNSTNTKSIQVLIFSNQKGEGKSFVFSQLANLLTKQKLKVQFLTHNAVTDKTEYPTINYSINESFYGINGISQLGDNISRDNFDFTFVEIPGILNNSYPVNLVRESDISILVVRANRAWSQADQNTLKDFQSVMDEDSLQIVLNGVELVEMENILGDLPKKRSKFRRMVKNILRLRFFTKTNF